MQMFSKQFGKMEATVMDSFMGFFVGNIGQCNCKLKQTWKETYSRTGQSGW